MTEADGPALLGWLRSDQVLDAAGRVMSWHNPAHPGYVYPEISGLLLSLLSRYDGADSKSGSKIAEAVVRDLGERNAVSRFGIDYVFDTAMVLSGLVAHADAGGQYEAPVTARLFRFIVETLGDRRGIRGSAAGDPSHWSNSYGCHLLKSALAVTAYAERVKGEALAESQAVLVQLLEDLLPLYDNGRFSTNQSSPESYLHAHCYATEGLLAISRRGFGSVDPQIAGSARWLASIQDASGGIRASHNGSTSFGPLRTDATSQAIRIWCLVDRLEFEANIGRGLAFLKVVHNPSGGLRYEPDSQDLNTWATIFGYQAIRWAERDEGALWLV